MLVLAAPTGIQAQDLIRCPDWQSLVSPAHLLSTVERAGQGSFEDKIRAANSGRRAAYSPLTPSGRPAPRDPTRSSRERRAGDPPAPVIGAVSAGGSCPAYRVQAGDTLGTIAARKLGSSRRWPEIARANPGADPNVLKVGATLKLPCATPLAGTSWLASLFGTKPATKKDADIPASVHTKEEAKPAAQAAKKKAPGTAQSAKKTPPTTSPAAPAPKPNPPLPVWTARKGEDFAVVLNRWGKAAGYRVVVGTTDAWTISVPVRLQADFETAIGQLVQGLGSDGKAPPVRIYQNKVVRLGGLP